MFVNDKQQEVTMEKESKLCYNGCNKGQMLREKLKQEILTLTEEQTQTIWRWLTCSKPESN